MIRVALPQHLRTLAGVQGEVLLKLSPPVSLGSVLDALEAGHPALRGTIRDHLTKERRPFLRYFACQKDLSLEPPETLVPDQVADGREPFLVVGGLAGG